MARHDRLDLPNELWNARPHLTRATTVKSKSLLCQPFVSDFIAKAILITLITAGLCLSSLRESDAETRRAVIIGIDKYSVADATASYAECVSGQNNRRIAPLAARKSSQEWRNLDGAVNDAMAIREILTTVYHFSAENILVLTDARATRENICSAIRTHLIDAATSGDVSVLYYAGHGSQVKNSLSDELDKKDESIVPSDGHDIRDKELNRLFNKAVDKGIVLTAIFDSCHSGSILRGEVVRRKTRFAPEDPNDVMDPPDDALKPEERGALVLSAARDDEDAQETNDNPPHGAFTVALLKALRNPQVNVLARDVFASAIGQLRAMGEPQQPVLAGSPERQRSPIFGGKASVAGRLRVAIGADEDGSLELLGGYPVGLTLNSELTKVTDSQGTSSTEPVRVRVTEAVSMGRSRFAVVAGQGHDINPGDLFELDRWVPPQGSMVKAWLPPGMTTEELLQVTKALTVLRTSELMTWVNDPTTVSPTHVLAWDGSVWRLSGTDGQVRELGRTITAEVIHNVLSSIPPPVRLFVRIPPSAELANALKIGVAQSKMSVEWVSWPEQADYLLSGNLSKRGVGYAWVLPNASVEDPRTKSLPLPIRTDWIDTDLSIRTQQEVSYQLEQKLLQIAKLRGWLTLESPSEDSVFPYRLVLRQSTSGEKPTDQVREGEEYQLVLTAEAEQLKQRVKPQHVYILVLSNDGKTHVLYPPVGRGDIENRFPLKKEAGRSHPTEIGLPKMQVGPPFGIDTYILLATNEPIGDLTGLESEAVKTRVGSAEAGLKSPLAILLSQIGSATRSTQTPVPTGWSVSQFSIRSVGKGKP